MLTITTVLITKFVVRKFYCILPVTFHLLIPVQNFLIQMQHTGNNQKMTQKYFQLHTQSIPKNGKNTKMYISVS